MESLSLHSGSPQTDTIKNFSQNIYLVNEYYT